MAYGRAARGFKAGGFNLTAPGGQETFGPETSWTYEAGLKTTWFDERLVLNTALFHIDWDDMQLSQFSPATGGYVSNAGESKSRGVEVEGAARVAPGLDLLGSFGYADTEFEEFVDQFGIDAEGHDLPFAPETTWSAGAQYRTSLGRALDFFVRGEYASVGSFFYDASNLAAESYALTSVRTGLESTHWRLEFWVNNAFDENYVPVAFQANPADPTFFVGESGAPRTFGVRYSLRF
jgi:iron complex outermembrane receptor protein